jgi:DNA polymerase elongation subunit (family B)
MEGMIPSDQYFSSVRHLVKESDPSRFVSIDIETLVRGKDRFLTGEPLIAITVSSNYMDPVTKIFMAVAETVSEEKRIMIALDDYLKKTDPVCIMGYNHISYDIPLLQMKLRRLDFPERLWNIGNYFGSTVLVDMMYVIARDLEIKNGEYRIRKLGDVVSRHEYSKLPMNRKKELVQMEGKNVGEAIEFLWKNQSEKFLQYCRGDTEDLLHIFRDIFLKQ